MSKFNKFLDENSEKILSNTKKVDNIKKENVSEYSSLKIKGGTLDKLRKLKLVTKEASYSLLIDKMIDNYIEQLPTKEKEYINILEQ